MLESSLRTPGVQPDLTGLGQTHKQQEAPVKEVVKVDNGNSEQFKHPPCQEGMTPSYGIRSLVGMQSDSRGEAEVENKLETQC